MFRRRILLLCEHSSSDSPRRIPCSYLGVDHEGSRPVRDLLSLIAK